MTRLIVVVVPSNRCGSIPWWPRSGRALATLTVVGAVAAWPGDAAAQTLEPCPAGRISDVVIQSHSVFDMTDPDRGGRLRWAYRLANQLHVPTRTDVIERELLFAAGDCYDLEVLLDSERLLRGMAFLADANIYGYPMPDGTVQIVVETRDEWSTRVEPRMTSGGSMGLHGIHLVEDNVVGTGRHLGLFYERERDERLFGASYSTPQMFDTRWNMALQVAQTEFGHNYHESVSYPFVGETGRVAFRQSIDRRDRYFELLMPQGDDELTRIWVPVSRQQFEVGGAFRWGGERYKHTVLGAAIAGERVRYPEEPSFADDEVEVSGSQVPLATTSWTPISNVRVMLLTGQRNIYYVRRRAIDTVNAVEDIQLGVEAEASFGPTLPVMSKDRDVAVGLRLAAAGEVGGSLLAGGQFVFEGRRSYETLPNLPEWHDVLTEVDLWSYFRPSVRSNHLWVFSASALGGWHSRVPFQLTLGGDAGLRGYPRHVDPGGRRIVGTIEHRAYLGWPMPELLDLGTVAFLDIGKIWPGHTLFGVDSPVRASFGVGIRAAFPPGSRQTFRLDLGLPIESGMAWSDLSIRIGVGQAVGRRSILRDPQLLRSTRYSLSTVDFENRGGDP